MLIHVDPDILIKIPPLCLSFVLHQFQILLFLPSHAVYFRRTQVVVIQGQVSISAIFRLLPRAEDSPASVFYAQLLEDVPNLIVIRGKHAWYGCVSRKKWGPSCHFVLVGSILGPNHSKRGVVSFQAGGFWGVQMIYWRGDFFTPRCFATQRTMDSSIFCQFLLLIMGGESRTK